jgi:hypothetical protein
VSKALKLGFIQLDGLKTGKEGGEFMGAGSHQPVYSTHKMAILKVEHK